MSTRDHLTRRKERRAKRERFSMMISRAADQTRAPRPDRQRVVLAVSLAILVHAIAVALIPGAPRPPAPERVVSETVALIRRTPPPTPHPTPAPTLRPRARVTSPPHPTLAPRAVVRNPAPQAAATPRQRLGGAAARLRIAIVPPKVATTSARRSFAQGLNAGQQNGGAGTGAGAGNGTGGLGGTGSGTGGNGNGNDGAANAGPCGAVYLLPAAVSYRPDGTVVQNVLAKVVFGDGSVEVGPFPYPFTYPAEKLNPFTHEAASAAGRIPVQLPPPGMDMSSVSKAVQIALQYTNPATGTTTLPECASGAQPAG